MRKEQLFIKKFLHKGFSLVELLISISIFLLFVSAIVNTTVGVKKQIVHASNIERASILAGEAVEVVRNIRDNNFANLVDGVYGLATSSGQWVFNGTSDSYDIFDRYLTISTISENQKKVDVSVSWSDSVLSSNNVSLSTYLTYWRKVSANAGITVTKSVINHGGTKIAQDFAPFTVGTTTVELASSTSFESGTYIVSETNSPDYNQFFSGDCDSSGSVTLASGDAKICSITNEEKPSKIVVNKTVINHGQNKTASDFSLYVDAVPVVSGDINTFNSGNHTVSESIDIDYTSTIGGDCDSFGLVTLVPDQTKTCTITNEEILRIPTVISPTVTLITGTTATLGANVTSLGAPAFITERGTCYGTSPAPTTNCIAEGATTTGIFTQARTGFIPATNYYYRGYATNSTGTGYSEDGTFTTPGGACAITGIIPTTYDSGGSASALVLKPTGVVQNDLMFAYILHNNATDRLTTIPSGWIQIGRHKNGTSNQALYYKIAGASEPANYTFGLSASSRFAVTINAYRGCFNTSNPINTSSNVEYVVNDTTYRAASLSLTSPYTTVIMFPSVNTTGAKTFGLPLTQGGGWTQDYSNGNASSRFSRNAFSKLIMSSGSTGVIDSIGFLASTVKHAFAVALNPL